MECAFLLLGDLVPSSYCYLYGVISLLPLFLLVVVLALSFSEVSIIY